MNSAKTGQSFVRKGLWLSLFAILILVTTEPVTPAQQATGSPAAATVSASTLPAAQIEEIIRAFTSKETRFRQALNTYAFKRDALVQTIGMGGQVTGEYHLHQHAHSREDDAAEPPPRKVFAQHHPADGDV